MRASVETRRPTEIESLFDPREFTTVVSATNTAALPKTYDIGKPMEMIMREAPNAGDEAHRIWEKGKPVGEVGLPLDREVVAEEAVRNSFVFVQVYGLEGGIGEQSGQQVACISNGLTWDRQRPMEQTAKDIVTSVAGRDALFVWFGPHKLVAFVKNEQDPSEILQRLVDAPRKPYERNFSNLSKAQSEIQDIRQREILDDPNGTGNSFKKIFDGTKNGLERAYQDNGKHAFVWGYVKSEKDELWGINLDNQPQSMTTLAIESPDEETREMLLAIQNYFKGKDIQNRYVVEFDFSSTVSCCNISFNAQWDKDMYTAIKGEYVLTLVDGRVVLSYPNGERYSACPRCRKNDAQCACKQADEEKTSGE